MQLILRASEICYQYRLDLWGCGVYGLLCLIGVVVLRKHFF